MLRILSIVLAVGGALCCFVCGLALEDWWMVGFSSAAVSLLIPSSALRACRKVFVCLLVAILLWTIRNIYVEGVYEVGSVCGALGGLGACLLGASFRIPLRVRAALWLAVLGYFAWQARICISLPDTNEGRCAYLERGRWGITHTGDRVLTIRSQYSYSLVKQALGAEAIRDFSSLCQYDSLWMVTPTEVFSPEEIVAIESWVRAGGNLVVVSDHTDLFGHATVLEPLLARFGMGLGKNCILPPERKASHYMSVGGSFEGLTANTLHGSGWPFLLQSGYSEQADYNGVSFFSDNAVTDEDASGLFCVGSYRKCGKGEVSVFGDSTLFSDFAFSKPSAQFAFRMLRDRLFRLDVPLLVLLFCGACGASKVLDSRMRRQLVALALGAAGVYLGCWFTLNLKAMGRPLFKDGCIETVETSGDWGLVDGERSEYSVLFATAYAEDVPFPEWRMTGSSTGPIRYGGHSLTLGAVRMSESDSLGRFLCAPLSMSVADYLADLIAASAEDSLWFDSGVGCFKELAYHSFWTLIRSAAPELREPQPYTGDCYVDGDRLKNQSLVLRIVKDDPEWCVVGDWIVGKMVDGKILVKDKWQHPRRRFGDMVIEVEDL